MDLREPEVLLAWQVVMARLEAHSHSDGLAALLLKNYDAEPKSDEAGFVLEQAQSRLPMLVSSTRRIDISGAVGAALPLIEAGSGMTLFWGDFLTGYICGLKTSPLLDVDCMVFLSEFGKAIAAKSTRSDSAGQAWIGCTAHGDDLPWIRVVLEAIGYGSMTLSALLAKRAMNTGHTSGTDAMFGALLGSVLWRGCPYESELVGRLCGSAAHLPQADELML